MKKYIIWLILLSAILPNSLFAYTTFNGQQQLRIENNIEDNVYAAGWKIDITGNISGDLTIAGGELMINGTIWDNALVTGGNIEINGITKGDLTVAGGDILLQGPVSWDIKAAGWKVHMTNSASGDVNIAGWDIRIDKQVIIDRDLGIAGGNITIAGLIRWKADIFAGNLDIDAIINKDVTIRIEDAKKLHIGSNAKILGKLTYKSQTQIPELEKIAVGWATYAGVPEFSHNEKNQEMFYGFVTWYVIYRLLFLLIMGSILLVIFRNFIRKTAEIVQKTPGKSFLYGLLYFILTPIIALLCFITVVGIPFWFLTVVIYIFGFVFAKLITLVVASEFINTTWQNKLSQSWQRWGIFIILALILSVVSGIDFIATLFAFGALLQLMGDTYSKKSLKE